MRPLVDLQDALALAVASKGAMTRIWVAAGTYKPDLRGAPRNASFTLVDGVALYGGFAGTETFTFEAEDAEGRVSPQATMTMDVSPVVANTLRLKGEDDHVTVADNGSLDEHRTHTTSQIGEHGREAIVQIGVDQHLLGLSGAHRQRLDSLCGGTDIVVPTG